jgi:hypothetical protein|tara:strand:- start:143 stop:814 length:672 start_codon:yes stop_codon:yes gene_type:complete
MATSTAYPQGSNMQGIGTGGIMGINSPLPGLIEDHYNPLDMGKYIGNPNHNPVYSDFMQSEFNTGGPGLAVMSDVYYGDGQKNTFGNSASANQFRQYLESMGIPIHSGPQDGIDSQQPLQPITQPGGPSNPISIMPFPDMGLQPLPGPELKQLPMPEIPDYTEKFSGYDTKIGGFDNQFKDIVSRLDKLEQGIGSMANTDVPAPTPVQGGVPSVYTGNNARGY